VEVFSKEMEGAQDLVPAFEYAKGSGAQALVFITDSQRRVFCPRNKSDAVVKNLTITVPHRF
jgi:hypothetical protein